MENQANVLIVDDELGPRESLKTILYKYYEVSMADCGEKALELINKENIDVVTLDLKMPGIPGIEVLKTIKDMHPEVEVIIITGFGTFETATEAVRYGAFDYITKPFNDINEITISVKRALEKKLLLEQIKHKNKELEQANQEKNELIEEVNLLNSKLQKKVELTVEELKETQQLLIQSEKMAAIGQLTAGITHEIKNPLSSISIFSQLCIDAIAKDNPLYEHLSIINKETERCIKITHNLLDFSCQSDSTKEQININNVINETMSILEYQLTRENIAITTKFDYDPLVVLADSNQLKQVLINLIINAQQAMGAQGQLTIKTSKSVFNQQDMVTNNHLSKKAIEENNGVVKEAIKIGKECAQIDISDTGHGISKNNLNRLFEPFFTTKGKGKGFGLGLSVSYGIIKNHNGFIRVTSEEGAGTTFTIKLPLDL